jgi:hypothetical protein
MSVKRRYLVSGILVLAGLIAAGVWIAGLFSEEAKVKRAVAEGVRAFEVENLEGCLRIISDKYQDVQGWDKARIREGLVRLFGQFSELKAEVTGLKVNLGKDKATVKCEIRVRGKSEGTLMFLVGNLTSKEEAVLYFAKEDGKWRLTRVEGLGVRE